MARALFALFLVVAVAVAGYGAVTLLGTSELKSRADVEAARLNAKDQYIAVAGATIRVRDEGPRDAPVLVMLHGFTFSLETWDGLVEALGSGYRVVRYDLLGHGLTGPDAQQRYAPKERAAFLGEVLNALDLQQPTLIGNSLGGLVAWRHLATAPDAANALVLVSPGAFPFNGVGDQPAPVPPPVAFVLRNPNAITVGATFQGIYGSHAEPSEARLATTLAMMQGNGDAFVESLEEFTLPDPTKDLAKINVPTLIVWGADDSLIPPSHGPKLQAAMPRAELLTYANVGHVAQEEIPLRLASDIREFLTSSVNGAQE